MTQENESTVENSTEPNKKKRKKKRLIWLLILLLLALIATITLHELGYFYYPWESRTMIGSTAKKGNLPSMSDEELKKELQRRADKSKVSFKINSQPKFETGKSAGSLMMANPKHNLYDMKVFIYLKKDDELIYESTLIKPDHYVDMDTLKKNLPAGIHEAYANLVFFDKGEQLSHINVDLKIDIEK